MMTSEVRGAVPEDKEWVGKVFEANRKWLWDFNTAWYRYWNPRRPNEHWLVVPEKGFAHYLVRRDGTRVLYEIAVAADAKRQGVASRLLEALGGPIHLKTDADNDESNGLYRAQGFLLLGQKPSRDGKRLFNVWERP